MRPDSKSFSWNYYVLILVLEWFLLVKQSGHIKLSCYASLFRIEIPGIENGVFYMMCTHSIVSDTKLQVPKTSKIIRVYSYDF